MMPNRPDAVNVPGHASRRVSSKKAHGGNSVSPVSEAERAGFEPATDLSARTRFPVALLRPLGHLSGPGAEYPGRDWTAGPLGHLSGPEAENPGRD